MKLLAVGLALIACFCNSEAGRIEGGYLYQHRERLGHFKDEPYVLLYKTYNSAFLREMYKNDVAADDYSNYRPTADRCVSFFRLFQTYNYELQSIPEFVIMDACLGYLFEEDGQKFHQQDSEESINVADALPALIADEKLQEIYNNTKIDTDALSYEAKDCFGNLFYDTILVYNQHPDLAGGQEYIQPLLKFASCQNSITLDHDSDSYLRIAYELVERKGKENFHEEIKNINEDEQRAYEAHPFKRTSNRLKAFTRNKQAQQVDLRGWTAPMVDLMRIVESKGKKDEINPREVHAFLYGINKNNDQLIRGFLENISRQATKHIKPKRKSKEKQEIARSDPNGAQRYKDWVDDICSWVRTSSIENAKFDFTTPLTVLVRMLSYEEVFHIDEKYFRQHVIKAARETVPVYLSVLTCNFLAFTRGVFASNPSANVDPEYIVTFAPDLSKMPRWPDAGSL